MSPPEKPLYTVARRKSLNFHLVTTIDKYRLNGLCCKIRGRTGDPGSYLQAQVSDPIQINTKLLNAWLVNPNYLSSNLWRYVSTNFTRFLIGNFRHIGLPLWWNESSLHSGCCFLVAVSVCPKAFSLLSKLKEPPPITPNKEPNIPSRRFMKVPIGMQCLLNPLCFPEFDLYCWIPMIHFHLKRVQKNEGTVPLIQFSPRSGNPRSSPTINFYCKQIKQTSFPPTSFNRLMALSWTSRSSSNLISSFHFSLDSPVPQAEMIENLGIFQSPQSIFITFIAFQISYVTDSTGHNHPTCQNTR